MAPLNCPTIPLATSSLSSTARLQPLLGTGLTFLVPIAGQSAFQVLTTGNYYRTQATATKFLTKNPVIILQDVRIKPGNSCLTNALAPCLHMHFKMTLLNRILRSLRHYTFLKSVIPGSWVSHRISAFSWLWPIPSKFHCIFDTQWQAEEPVSESISSVTKPQSDIRVQNNKFLPLNWFTCSLDPELAGFSTSSWKTNRILVFPLTSQAKNSFQQYYYH